MVTLATNPKVQHILSHIARADFESARRRAKLSRVISLFSRKRLNLLSLRDLQAFANIEYYSYRGIEQVQVACIVGSTDRYNDFDGSFYPSQAHTRERWERVDLAMLADATLPPVELFKVGDMYFVKDGNHRVSVAKYRGVDFLDAEVIALTPTPIKAYEIPQCCEAA